VVLTDVVGHVSGDGGGRNGSAPVGELAFRNGERRGVGWEKGGLFFCCGLLLKLSSGNRHDKDGGKEGTGVIFLRRNTGVLFCVGGRKHSWGVGRREKGGKKGGKEKEGGAERERNCRGDSERRMQTRSRKTGGGWGGGGGGLGHT